MSLYPIWRRAACQDGPALNAVISSQASCFHIRCKFRKHGGIHASYQEHWLRETLAGDEITPAFQQCSRRRMRSRFASQPAINLLSNGHIYTSTTRTFTIV